MEHAFLVTLGIGLAIVLTGFAAVAAIEVLREWCNLIEAAKRYAVRNEVVMEYYDVEKMQQVWRYGQPKPERVELAKKRIT
jgi:hypothetical protein